MRNTSTFKFNRANKCICKIYHQNTKLIREDVAKIIPHTHSTHISHIEMPRLSQPVDNLTRL